MPSPARIAWNSLAQDCSQFHPSWRSPHQSSDRSTGAVEAREGRVPISTQRIWSRRRVLKLAYRRLPRGNLRSTHCARSRNSALARRRSDDARDRRDEDEKTPRPARARNVVAFVAPGQAIAECRSITTSPSDARACISPALSGRHDLRRRLGLGLSVKDSEAIMNRFLERGNNFIGGQRVHEGPFREDHRRLHIGRHTPTSATGSSWQASS